MEEEDDAIATGSDDGVYIYAHRVINIFLHVAWIP